MRVPEIITNKGERYILADITQLEYGVSGSSFNQKYTDDDEYIEPRYLKDRISASRDFFKILNSNEYVDLKLKDITIRVNSNINDDEYLNLIVTSYEKSNLEYVTGEITHSDRMLIIVFKYLGSLLYDKLEDDKNLRRRIINIIRTKFKYEDILKIRILYEIISLDISYIHSILEKDSQQSVAVFQEYVYTSVSSKLDIDYINWLREFINFSNNINSRSYRHDSKINELILMDEYILMKAPHLMSNKNINDRNISLHPISDVYNIPLLRTLSNKELEKYFTTVITFGTTDLTHEGGFNIILVLEVIKRGIDISKIITAENITRKFLSQRALGAPVWIKCYEKEITKLGEIIVPHLTVNDYEKLFTVLRTGNSRNNIKMFNLLVGDNRNLISSPKLDINYLEQYSYMKVIEQRNSRLDVMLRDRDRLSHLTVGSQESKFVMMLITIFGNMIIDNNQHYIESPFNKRKDEEGYTRKTIATGIEAISKLNGSRKDKLIRIMTILMKSQKRSFGEDNLTEKVEPRVIREFVEELSNSTLRNATIEKIFGDIAGVTEKFHSYERRMIEETTDMSLFFGISVYEFREIISGSKYRNIIDASILKSILE
jgi:hypothetical protein